MANDGAAIFRKRKYTSCSLPDQQIQISIVNVCIHVCEIAAHRQNDVIRTRSIRLCQNVTIEFFQLNSYK